MRGNCWSTLRISLHDILDFCVEPEIHRPRLAEGLLAEKLPLHPQPRHGAASVRAIEQDIAEFEKLAGDPQSNLYATIPWGDGQTLLREILLVGDHNSYHVGQLMMLKKQLTVVRGSPTCFCKLFIYMRVARLRLVCTFPPYASHRMGHPFTCSCLETAGPVDCALRASFRMTI